jgi:glycosyltransferase involved in cell wall biosynthesis
MDLPRLSVVLPNYNHACYLPACLDALLSQSIPPFELIVIDDASTDQSLEIIQEYGRRHANVRVVRNEQNRGVIYGMNRGTELAQGDYLYFPAADDRVAPGLFEKSLRLLAEHPQAGLCSTISEWHEVSTGLKWQMAAGMADGPRYLSPVELVRLGRRDKLLIVSHSAIMRKEALVEAGGFIPELRWHCDWFVTYVTGFRYGICHVPEPLSLVNLHETSYYGSGHRRAQHRAVLLKLLALLHSKNCADVLPAIGDSGALALFAMPMLRLILGHREYRHLLNLALLRGTIRRSAELQAKRWLPDWLKRWCLNRFYPLQRPAVTT